MVTIDKELSAGKTELYGVLYGLFKMFIPV
jgi:hypothetical protein